MVFSMVWALRRGFRERVIDTWLCAGRNTAPRLQGKGGSLSEGLCVVVTLLLVQRDASALQHE
jgi:hypothetical protein